MQNDQSTILDCVITVFSNHTQYMHQMITEFELDNILSTQPIDHVYYVHTLHSLILSHVICYSTFCAGRGGGAEGGSENWVSRTC